MKATIHRRWVRMLVACVLACGTASATAAYAQDASYPPGADVPAPGSAFVLPHAPQARMIDGSDTCELIAGIRARDGSLLQGGVYLFRCGQTEPFMHAATREDGLVIAHFPAARNETVLGSAHHRHPRSGRWVHAPRVATKCRAGNVRAGDLEFVDTDRRRP